MSKIAPYPHIEVAGEDAFIIYFDEVANEEVTSKISQLTVILQETLGDCLVELIPSYVSLLVVFNPLISGPFDVSAIISKHLSLNYSGISNNRNTIEIPVYYSEESGPDLKLLADNSGLSIYEVINIHQATTYQVYAIGFAPGFAFLGQVDERIASPRLSTPRKKVPKGAVGIADQQTAIYPESSPGGWNLIGLCPLELFDSKNTPHIAYQVGDNVKFTVISKAEFLNLGGIL
jgi:KipI family sensor histidine kinase inhibitor